MLINHHRRSIPSLAASLFWLVVAGAAEGNTEFVSEIVKVAPATDSAIDLTADGSPHIMYDLSAGGPAEYMLKNGSQWTSETVAAAASLLSITTNTLDEPLITYKSGLGVVTYARRTGGSWTIEDLFTGPPTTIVQGVSSTAEGVDGVHVAFLERMSGDINIQYGVRSGGVWTVEIAAPVTAPITFTEIDLDSQKDPHIVVSESSPTGLLRYMTKSGGTWTTELVAMMADDQADISVASDGTPRIAYVDETTSGIVVATREGGVWNLETIATAPLADKPRIEHDASGVPHVAYRDSTGIRYAHRTGATWTVQTIATGTGFCPPDLVLDADGNPHISYIDCSTDTRWYYHPKRRTIVEQHSWRKSVHFGFWMKNASADSMDGFQLLNPRWIGEMGGMPDSLATLESSSICDSTPVVLPATPPDRWTRVNWDSATPDYKKKAWWFFPPIPPVTAMDTSMAPEMDVVFGLPPGLAFGDSGSAWFEADFISYFGADTVDCGVVRFHCDAESIGTSVLTSEIEINTARKRFLKPNVPNPFNPRTTMRFDLNSTGPVILSIYNAQGERIKTLVDETLPAGTHFSEWDGRDARGRSVASGVYFYQIQVAGISESRKMVMLR